MTDGFVQLLLGNRDRTDRSNGKEKVDKGTWMLTAKTVYNLHMFLMT